MENWYALSGRRRAQRIWPKTLRAAGRAHTGASTPPNSRLKLPIEGVYFGEVESAVSAIAITGSARVAADWLPPPHSCSILVDRFLPLFGGV